MPSKDVWKGRKYRKEGLLGRKRGPVEQSREEVKQGSQGAKSRKDVKEGSQGNMGKWDSNMEVEEGSQCRQGSESKTKVIQGIQGRQERKSWNSR
jgi:hypothetical protein